jgi:hypothetical protein
MPAFSHGIPNIAVKTTQECEYGPFDPARITSFGEGSAASRACFCAISNRNKPSDKGRSTTKPNTSTYSATEAAQQSKSLFKTENTETAR